MELALIASIKSYALAVVCALLLAATATQTMRIHNAQTAYARLTAQVEQDRAARAQAALEAIERNAAQQADHAQQTQEIADAYQQTQLARDADARADRAAVERLRVNAERRAATSRAMSEAGAAAQRNLADRLAALDTHIVRGAGVVAGLRADLVRRDAEVALLRGQIDADRALFGAEK